MKFSDKLRYGKQYGYEGLFKKQPKRATGKVGVMISESGLPEDYDLEFYANFIEHVFRYTLPPFLVCMHLRIPITSSGTSSFTSSGCG